MTPLYLRPAMQCNMLEAKNQLSRLVQAALNGEDVVIAKHGTPIVRLVRIEPVTSVRQPGAWAELAKAEADWDAPEVNAAIADELAGSAWP